MKPLKIVAGMGSVLDYEDFVRAGVDEVFCGFVPGEVYRRFGRLAPANRREVLACNVQIGGENELHILAGLQEKHKVPVSLTFNAISYSDEERELLVRTAIRCKAIGFNRIIAAEEKLLLTLQQEGGFRLTLSGEYGELSSGTLNALGAAKLARVIFPRQTKLSEMKQMVRRQQKDGNRSTEWEAFVLNERCQFTGAYCQSFHTDEFGPLCRVPYRLDFGGAGGIASASAPKEKTAGAAQKDEMPRYEKEDEIPEIGDGGCGVCALWELSEAGITHVKLVSRGNRSEETVKDIRFLRQAMDCAKSAGSREEFIKTIRQRLFPDGCGKNCYYWEEYGHESSHF